MVKSLVKRILRKLGLEVKRYSPYYDESRGTMKGALLHAKRLGFSPTVVIDVGAAHGTDELYRTFPDSHHILVEPLQEYEETLRGITDVLKSAAYIQAAATNFEGSLTINVHPDLVGSSVYLEKEDSNVNGVPREVSCTTIDHLCENIKDDDVVLIKIDVQGAEKDVLLGATKTLNKVEYIILEAVFYDFFDGGSEIFDLIHFMNTHGFSIYEFFDPLYRPLDGAMSQVDIAFVKKSGMFRFHHVYATSEQREIQNQKLLELGKAEN